MCSIEGGKRLREDSPKSMLGFPLVTIITVVYNGVKIIEETIKSVISQTYPNLEYIIIDGGSTDGTVDIIKKYEYKISYWVSEKDNGVYVAMNKGTDLSVGEWVNFINAGDIFYDKDVIKKVFNQKNSNTDLVYGSAIEKKSDGTMVRKQATEALSELWKHAQFGHEGLFVKTEILKNNKFDLNYTVAADYDFIMKCFYRSYIYQRVEVDVFIFSPPCFSRQHWIKASIENWQIARKYKKTFLVDLYYFYNLLFSIFVKIIQKIVPAQVYRKLKDLYSYFKKRL